jgi:hypothetical protein
MRDLRDSQTEEDVLENTKVKLTDLPELGEDWDQDVDDFLGEINNREWDDWD